MSVIGVVSAQMEQVETDIQDLYESTTQLLGLLGPSKKVKPINRQLYRIPLPTRPGGQYSKYSADGGSLGGGTSSNFTHMTAGYIYSVLGFDLTEEEIDSTDTSEKAVINKFQRDMAEGIITAQVMSDIELHGDGTGELTAAASSSPGATQLIFAASGDDIGINRLREGLAVDVWNSAGSTLRADGPYTINTIDYASKTVTFGASVTGIAGTDLLAFANADAYGPASLTSFSSTWPATGTAAGLGGDSWRHGIRYSNDATAANYYLGVQKSSLPQLLPSFVAGGGGGLTHSHILQILDDLRRRRDEEQTEGVIGIFPFKQREQVFNIGMSIANKDIPGSTFGESVDLLPSNQKYSAKFEFGGVPCYVSKRQENSRVDFINPQYWCMATIKPLGFHASKITGQKIFVGRNSSGEVTANYQWFYTLGADYVNLDPGCGGYIDDLAVPA